MMKLLKWLPFRRVELLVILLTILGCLGMVAVMEDQFDARAASVLLLIILEILLPLAMGLLAAGLLAGDPVLDVVLSAHRPGWQVLLERLLCTFAIGVLFSILATQLAARWNLPLPKEGSAQMYIWLSPMVFYMGLASTFALLRGRMLEGVLAVMGVMGGSLMLLTQIPRLCANNAPDAPCPAWLSSPMMTVISPSDAYWPVNRLLWLFLGVLLVALSLHLSKREEPLLHEVTKE